MFIFRNKCVLVKKSENLNKYGPFFIIFPLPVMLKFTVHTTAVHLFTCVAKAVTSRRTRELYMYPQTSALDKSALLTHLSRMNFPISISRTSLFQILGVLSSIFQFYSYSYRTFWEPTVVTLIRHSAASDLGLHCLPMSHKKDARLIWVK